MNIVLVLAHPNPASFNHAIAEQARESLRRLDHNVIFRDLYKERFDPVIPLEEMTGEPSDPRLAPYLDEARTADGFVICHPNWWGQPPAILKGWVDRVLRPGVGYEFPPGSDPNGVPVGLLKARTALIFNTSNTPPARETEVFGDPLEALWGKCIFPFCGVENVYRRMFSTLWGSTTTERAEWLMEVDKMVAHRFSRNALP